MTMTRQSTVAAGARWCDDPCGRYELRWWDGETWTADVASGGEVMVDPLGITWGPRTAEAAVEASTPPTSFVEDLGTETWRTRPEGVATFLGNVMLCVLFPVWALWYGPKYAMRHEYWRASVCVAVAVTEVVLVLVLLAGA